MSHIIIDQKKMEKFLMEKELTKADLSRQLGMSDGYIGVIMARGYMSLSPFRLLQKIYDLPVDYFKPDPKPEPVIRHESTSQLIAGYETRLQVYPDKVRLNLMLDGRELHYAWAKIRGNTHLDLMQAISYASHMMYKYAEQELLIAGKKKSRPPMCKIGRRQTL